MKMMKAARILFFLLLANSGSSRLVRQNFNLVSDGMENKTQSTITGALELKASTVTCEPTYGFLPCTTVVWGQLFLIVMYEYLLTLGEQYVSSGSDLFFQMFGTGIFGASLFQILGTIPEVAVLFVTALSGSTETAESVATMGVSMLAGSSVMLLTLIWGSCVLFGSYDISDSSSSVSGNSRSFSLTGYGVTTDVATSYTARLMLVSMIPFLILQLAKLINSSSGIRVVILLSLAVTLVFLFLYCFYQIFQPWIQERRLDYVTRKFVRNNLVKNLLSGDGRPDESRIRTLFREIDQNKNGNISAIELRALLLGIKLEEPGLSTDDFVERVMRDFDTSGNAQINETEFHKGISKWLYEANYHDDDQDDRPPRFFGRIAQSEEQQSLVTTTTNQQSQVTTTTNQQSQTADNSWFNYFKAACLLIGGTAVITVLVLPIIETIEEFSSAINIPSFIISYFVIPVAMNFREGWGAIKSAREKNKKAISLTFSEIYNAVFMNNMMGLAVFLLLVYIRDLSWDVSAEVLVVLIICTMMGLLCSLTTKFPSWTGIIAYIMYPISLGLLYVLSEVLGWS